MDYCDKWRLVGFAIGITPFVLAVIAATFVARRPKRFWLACLFAGSTGVVVLVPTLPMSVLLWNGVSPASGNCDRR